MNLIQAGFDILCVFAISDGHLDEREDRIITEYLQANFEGEFDIKNEFQFLISLNEKGLLRIVEEAAIFFDETTTMENKLSILDFCLDLSEADGKVTDEEFDLLNFVCEIWGIDFNKFLDSKGR